MIDIISPLVLFFDVFIVDDFESKPKSYYENTKRRKIERAIRDSESSYKYATKLDIAKYTLASYAIINWTHVIIRFETENPADSPLFYDYCKELFPLASIYIERSDTAKKYVMHLEELNKLNDPWVFFSPNNDHPFIAAKKYDFVPILAIAEAIGKNNNDSIVSIAYSHYTESINIVSRDKKLWGTYSNIYPSKIFEDNDCVVIKLNKFLCDSIQIFRLSVLIKIFSETKNNGRVIRLEDTEYYLCKNVKHLLVIPKMEICRHYDGYYHNNVWGSMWNSPSPLFIPVGFFDSKIKIRYGYDDYLIGFVNINPAAPKYIYQDKSGVDLKCLFSEVPCFWRSKINEIIVNSKVDQNAIALGLLNVKSMLYDPWGTSPEINILQSYVRQIIAPLLFLYQYLRVVLYEKYGKNKLYRMMCLLRDKFLNLFDRH